MPDEDVAVLEPTTDEEVAVPDEAEADVAEEASDDSEETADELLAALDELGPDDPLAQKLLEKLELLRPPVEEERLQWEDQRELDELKGNVRAAWQQAGQYDPQPAYERALATAYDFTTNLQADVQAKAKAIADGDPNIDPDKQWVLDADGLAVQIANHVTQEVSAAAPAIRAQTSLRILETFLESKRQSPVHKLLTPQDRQMIAEAKKLPFVDQRIGRIDAIYLNRAIQGAGTIREGMTKAEAEAEEKKAAARERVAQAIGKRMPNGRPNAKNDAARLEDPNTPIEELIAIRRRQQAAG